MMLKDKEPIDKIKKYTGFATDKLEEIAKSMGMTLRNMVVGMHAFNRTSEAEKKVFISYNLFYYRLAVLLYPRARLKKAFCKMCVTICGIFCPDEGAVAGYGN